MKKLLTKSRYMAGLQCPKMLWYNLNPPKNFDVDTTPDPVLENRFHVGTLVGGFARKCFEEGILIAEDNFHLKEAEEATKAAAKGSTSTIFEATAKDGRLLCRADALYRCKKPEGTWDMYEVKQSTRVKDGHIPDLAIQKYCFEKAGHKLRKVYLTHINNEYVRNGEIDPDELFIDVDMTKSLVGATNEIKKKVKAFEKVLDAPKAPDIEPGDQCEKPYICPYCEMCNGEDEPHTIYDLSYGGKTVTRLEEAGIEYVKDIPDDFEITNHRHFAHIQAIKTDKPFVEPKELKKFLNALQYPLYFFDFETVSRAIPLFDNSRPFQMIPFQYSLHVQEEPNGPCEHLEFLMEDNKDPRPRIIKRMLAELGKKGSIVAYNISFEKKRIEELARDFPKHAPGLMRLLPRFWDLIIPFRKGWYSHKDFRGSASIKDVLPVLVPSLSYKNLEVQQGDMASLIAEQRYAEELDESEWKKQRSELLKYCELDTLAMVEILKKLYELIS